MRSGCRRSPRGPGRPDPWQGRGPAPRTARGPPRSRRPPGRRRGVRPRCRARCRRARGPRAGRSRRPGRNRAWTCCRSRRGLPGPAIAWRRFYLVAACYAPSVSAPYVDPPDKDRQDDRPRDRRRLAVLWRLTVLMRPYRARFFFALVMLLGASGLTLVYPLAAKYAVDLGMKGTTT